MPKKKFFDTKFGGILKSVAKGAAKSVPVIGDVMDNIESQDAGQGNIDWNKLGNQAIRILVLLAILFGLLETEKAAQILELFF